MNRTRVQQNYSKNFINLVLAVVSIIQGLAFNDLTTRFPLIYSAAVATEDYLPVTHFILCFVLLLRVFQTYVTAALDYEEWRVNFMDIFLIFLVGFIEYFVFSSLSASGFDVLEFHRRLSVLSILAFLGYFAAFLRLRKKRESFSSDREYVAESRLQTINVIGVLSVQCISTFILLAPAQSNGTYAWLGFTASLILTVNILYSLVSTFSTDIQLTPVAASGPTDVEGLTQTTRERQFSIRRGQRNDTAIITELLVGHFSYVYANLFDTSLRLTKRMFKTLLLLNSDRQPAGYRSFYVALDERSGDVVGLISLSSLSLRIDFSQAITFLGWSLVVLWYLGPIGLLRTLRNSKSVRMATDPVVQLNELHVNYLVVATEYRRQSAGSQLIEFACKEATRLRKQYLSLEVREKNISAQAFFRKQGFREVARLESEYDSDFEQGFRIVMRKEVPRELIKGGIAAAEILMCSHTDSSRQG